MTFAKRGAQPIITIVTPSLNQGSFLEETIQSVLSQGYPRLEYIVADGGSSDNTIDILTKYDDKLVWFSDKDGGQAQAINRGLSMATGEIVSYLNADDVLLKGTLATIAQVFKERSDVTWLTGRCRIIDEKSSVARPFITSYKNFLLRRNSFNLLLITNFISQPATFWRKSAAEQIGSLDESLHFMMDYDYWLRLWEYRSPYIMDDELAGFRIQRRSKTASSSHSKAWTDEERRVVQRYTRSKAVLLLHDLHRLLISSVYAVLNPTIRA